MAEMLIADVKSAIEPDNLTAKLHVVLTVWGGTG